MGVQLPCFRIGVLNMVAASQDVLRTACRRRQPLYGKRWPGSAEIQGSAQTARKVTSLSAISELVILYELSSYSLSSDPRRLASDYHLYPGPYYML